MRLVSAFTVEEDLQRTWREEREGQCKSDVREFLGRCKDRTHPGAACALFRQSDSGDLTDRLFEEKMRFQKGIPVICRFFIYLVIGTPSSSFCAPFMLQGYRSFIVRPPDNLPLFGLIRRKLLQPMYNQMNALINEGAYQQQPIEFFVKA